MKNHVKLFEHGHNLHLIKDKDKFLGFLGQVDFEGVSILIGESIDSLTPCNISLPGFRTPTAIIDGGKVFLFCARKRGIKGGNIWRWQEICCFESADRLEYKLNGIATQGSAPFIFKHLDKYYLYYHLHEINTEGIAAHCIMVKVGESIESLIAADPSTLITKHHTFSMPSVVYRNGAFHMTCEDLSSGKWRSVLFTSDYPDRDFTCVDCDLIEHPCVYQHVIDGVNFITYSKQKGGGWELWKAELEE